MFIHPKDLWFESPTLDIVEFKKNGKMLIYPTKLWRLYQFKPHTNNCIDLNPKSSQVSQYIYDHSYSIQKTFCETYNCEIFARMTLSHAP